MPSTLLLEIGCEELPTSFLDGALSQLAALAPEALAAARVEHGPVRALGTARRLSLLVEGVADAVAAREEELLGPPESASRAADGSWTKAAEGFAKKNGLPLDALSIADTPKGRYLRAVRATPGAETRSLLPAVLAELCKKIAFPKSMRWGDGDTAFGRPVQWIVALLDDAPLDVSFAGVRSGTTSKGHRFLSSGDVSITDARGYVAALDAAKVKVDPAERRAMTLSLLRDAAAAAGGALVDDAFLEREVVGLVEWPHVVTGRFAESYLSLPHVLIEDVMRVHQRYFAVRAGEGLLPVFLTVTNTAEDPATIALGNERVMRARLNDASFFVEQDRKKTLASRVEGLDAVTFHAKLGSYGDKVRRLERLGAWLAPPSAPTRPRSRAPRPSARATSSRSRWRVPGPSGHIGAWLARHDGEAPAVAEAVAQHYQPKGAGDDVARGKVGAALAVADRLDTLVGCLAVGLKPTGGEDPFGLRRLAIGALRTLMAHGARVSLREAAGEALAGYRAQASAQGAGRWATAFTDAAKDDVGIVTLVSDFCAERMKGMLEERHGRDAVAAAMGARKDDPVDVMERVDALGAFWKTPAAEDLAVAFRRVFNISREAPSGELSDDDRALLVHPAEVALIAAFEETRDGLAPLLAARDYTGAMDLIARTLRAPVDRLFTEVFVMSDDAALRDSRLRLLGRVADAVGAFARFDALD
ncbi:MAG: glycine--tRNA ligase subunit beta [Polyangiales bacterium]